MAEDLQIRAAYDPRFGTLQLGVVATARLKLASLLRDIGVSPEELAALMADGYQWTEGEDNIEPARLRMLEQTDWTGKTVLDIGGYDGFAAEIAHKGGAARAICLDNQQYQHYGWNDKRLPGVEYITGDLMDLLLSDGDEKGRQIFFDPDKEPYRSYGPGFRFEPKQPDVLINYNVLYHVKNPWAFLDKCRELIQPTGEMLLCTLFRYHKGAWMYVYEPRECNPTDDTVYFGPSLEALERLLRATGWDFVQEGLAYDRVVYRCKPVEGWVRTHEDT